MTKIIRKKITTGLPVGLGCDYTVNDNGDFHGQMVSTRLWHLFMSYPSPVVTTDDKGKDLSKKAIDAAESTYQETYTAEKAKAVAFVKLVSERGPGAIKLWVHGDNAKTGDSVADPETKNPVETLQGTWNSVVDGTWKLRSGAADAAGTVRELLSSLDAVVANVMAMTAAKKIASGDEPETLYAKIATARGVTTVAYTTDLEARVAAALVVATTTPEGTDESAEA